MKKYTTCIAICLLALILCGCVKSAAVKDLEKGIKSIESVTSDSLSTLTELRASYNALSAEEQASVDEKLLLQLESAENICSARIFEQEISDIGNITENSGDLLLSVRDMYDSMPKEAQDLVDPVTLQAFLDAEKEYDELIAEQILSQIYNTKKLTIEEAYEIVFSHTTKNEELLKLQQDIADLSLCAGTFYQDGSYKSELVIYLQYGEYWFDFDYAGYSGYLSENKLERDGENGFLFKAKTNGSHINFLTGWFDETYFTLRFAENKLFVSWGYSEYYLDRNT